MCMAPDGIIFRGAIQLCGRADQQRLAYVDAPHAGADARISGIAALTRRARTCPNLLIAVRRRDLGAPWFTAHEENANSTTGAMVLRAKIRHGLAQRMNLRDPAIYASAAPHIRHAATSGASIRLRYTHCISDALEGITHSICTLDFEDHRPSHRLGAGPPWSVKCHRANTKSRAGTALHHHQQRSCCN